MSALNTYELFGYQYGTPEAIAAVKGFRHAEEEIAKLREELTKLKQERNGAIEQYLESQKAWRNAKQRAERAEARIAETEKQEPDGYLVVEFFDEKTRVRQVGYEYSDELLKRGIGRHPIFLRPIPPADVAELQAKKFELLDAVATYQQRIAELERSNIQYAKDVLTLIKQFRYCVGIAERGTGKECPPEECGELFLLEYVKGLERKLAEQQVLYKEVVDLLVFNATRHAEVNDCVRKHVANTESPTSSGELNTVIAKAREEGRKEAVPDGYRVVPDEQPAGAKLRCDRCGNERTIKFEYAMLAAAPKQEVKP